MNKNKNPQKLISVAAVGAVVNVLLFTVKLYLAISTNSIAIYADAINNLLDSAVCGAAIVGFKIITLKPGGDYPFGFGRVENLLNLIISLSTALTGLYFAYISLERFFYPAPVWYSQKYALIVASTVLVKILLAVFYARAKKKSGSVAVKGLFLDSLLDFFVTLCVLLSFTLAEKINFSVDGASGIIVGIILSANGIKLFYNACTEIIGKRNDSVCDELKLFLEKSNEQLKIKDVQCHSYGDKKVFTVALTDKAPDNINEITEKAEAEFNSEIFVKTERE